MGRQQLIRRCRWLRLRIVSVDSVQYYSPTHAFAGGVCPRHLIPFLRNHKFVGRESAINQLENKFFRYKDCLKIAVVGLDGMGKTQVVLQFVHQVRKAHPERSIFWIPAVSFETFVQAYSEIAKLCSIPINAKEEDPRVTVKR